MTTTAKRATGKSAEHGHRLHGLFTLETSFGWLAANWTGGRLECLAFGYKDPAQAVAALRPDEIETGEAREPSGEARRFAERVQAYFDGVADDFLDVPIASHGNTRFQRKILQHCRRIPYGATRSYAELARAAGSPKACRAVGNIMARNRIPLIVPCHRVVGSHGSLGGYSAPSGLALKRQLLELEGAEIMRRDAGQLAAESNRL
jgi:methylated-DNA-[protein]-cysteine S-methyltransferase